MLFHNNNKLIQSSRIEKGLRNENCKILLPLQNYTPGKAQGKIFPGMKMGYSHQKLNRSLI